jgi:hypothetical protein
LRIANSSSIAVAVLALSCKSVPTAGPLGEGAAFHTRISAVDSTHPPRTMSIELDKQGYTAVLLVAPGHSASLVYPPDSLTDNRLSAGMHELALVIPNMFVRADSSRSSDRARPGFEQPDSGVFTTGRQRDSTMRARGNRRLMLSPSTPTYLLLVTSPQPLVYGRIIEKTSGVSIPTTETEALNAVAKAVKSTIQTEPRDWAGAFQKVELQGKRR